VTETRINKADVPYLWRPRALGVELVMLLAGGVVVLSGMPELRPGLAELATGLLLGVPAGIITSLFIVLYVSEVAARCREKPQLKWLASFTNPSTRSSLLGLPVMAVVLFGGLLGVPAVLHALFGQPHTRQVHAQWPDFASPPAMSVYMLCFVCMPALRMWLWYRSLPDE